MPSPLEQLIPVYHFREVHRRSIPASQEEVWQALTALRLDQLALVRPLVALRHLGHRPPARQSLLADGPVRILHAEAPGYALGAAITRPWQRRPLRFEVATTEQFTRFAEPGWTKYLTDFRIEPHGDGVLLTTETRGYSTDDHARRRFALYWAVIRLPSGLIRRDMLATIGRHATLAATATATV